MITHIPQPNIIASNSSEYRKTINEYIGNRIRSVRKLKGLSQEALALSLSVKITQQQIHKYEAGIDSIPASMLFEIAHIFGVAIETFIPLNSKKTDGLVSGNHDLEVVLENTIASLKATGKLPEESLESLRNILRSL